MSLIARDSGGGGSFTPVPPGMYLARCYRIIDLGTQKSDGQYGPKSLQKVMLQFEVHGEDDAGKSLTTAKGEAMSISKNFTLSLAEKATLRIDLQTWRGKNFTPEELKGFELKNVLGAWAMLNVSKSIGNNGKEYTNIATINSVPKQLRENLPTPSNKIAIFSIENPDMALFETFSNSTKLKIEASPEWRARSSKPSKPTNPGVEFEDLDSDIPF